MMSFLVDHTILLTPGMDKNTGVLSYIVSTPSRAADVTTYTVRSAAVSTSKVRVKLIAYEVSLDRELLAHITMQPICWFLCTTHTGPKKTHHISRCKSTRRQPMSRRERSNPNHPSLPRRTCVVNFRTVHRIMNLVVRQCTTRSEVQKRTWCVRTFFPTTTRAATLHPRSPHRHSGESAQNFCTCKPRYPLAEEMTPTSSHKRRTPTLDQNSG